MNITPLTKFTALIQTQFVIWPGIGLVVVVVGELIGHFPVVPSAESCLRQELLWRWWALPVISQAPQTSSGLPSSHKTGQVLETVLTYIKWMVNRRSINDVCIFRLWVIQKKDSHQFFRHSLLTDITNSCPGANMPDEQAVLKEKVWPWPENQKSKRKTPIVQQR